MASITTLPTLAVINDLALKSLVSVPRHLKDKATDLKINVENFAPYETLNSLNIEERYELLGLYKGVPIPLKAEKNKNTEKDCIHLYRCPLVRYSEHNGKDLAYLVSQVIYHELTHHFGYEDMSWL